MTVSLSSSASSFADISSPDISSGDVFNYESVRNAPVATAPCPHLVVKDFLSPAALKRVLELLPDIPSGGSFPRAALGLPVELEGMLGEFEGPRLKEILAEKFGLDLTDAPSMVTLRGRTRQKDGRIHLDSASKRVTILLYLNPLEQEWPDHKGCLRFLNDPKNLEDYAAEITPTGGTLVAFPNGPRAWHGHRKYVGPRITVQLNYMHADRKVRAEQLRHRLSAFWKRATGAQAS